MNVKHQIYFLLLFFLLLRWSSFGQNSNLGILPVQNFSKKSYQAGTQNWDISQDQRGVVYFGNNEGLLEFDGIHWRKYPLSNQTIVRSVEIAPDGKIYVGGQGEFGYFLGDEKGILRYHSLSSEVPEEHANFADVWDIELINDAVLFSTGQHVFKWQNEQIKAYVTGSAISYMGKIGGTIYIHDEDRGLLQFLGDKFIIPAFQNKPESPVTGHLAWRGDTSLIATHKHGLFVFDGQSFTPFTTSIDAFLREKTDW